MSEFLESDPVAKTIDPNSPSTASLVTGWVLTILPGAFLLFIAAMKFIQPGTPEEAKFLDPLGWKLEQLHGLGILEFACVIPYLIPRTSVLGAILVTG